MRYEPPAAAPGSIEQLLQDARDGSREALGKLLNAFRGYLLHIGDAEIRCELRPKGSASDLVQDTFMAAQRAFPRFRGDSPEEVCAWLRTIFVRRLADFRRRYDVRAKRQVARELPLDDSRAGARVKETLAAPTPSPSTEAIRAEQAELLGAAIRKLPDGYRRVITLRAGSRMPFEAIGRELGCSADAAEKIWVRAVKHLSASLKPHWPFLRQAAIPPVHPVPRGPTAGPDSPVGSPA